MKGMKFMKIRMVPPDNSPFMLFTSFMVQSCVPAELAAVGMAAEEIFYHEGHEVHEDEDDTIQQIPFMLFMSFMVQSCVPAELAAVGMAAEEIFYHEGHEVHEDQDGPTRQLPLHALHVLHGSLLIVLAATIAEAWSFSWIVRVISKVSTIVKVWGSP